MEESQKVSDQSGQVSDLNQTEDVVRYDTYSKVLNEAKTAKQKTKDLQAMVESLTNEKLAAEGKKDELMSRYKDDSEKYQRELKEKESLFAWSVVKGAITEEALKAGCKNVDLFIKDIKEEEFEDIKMSENYDVDRNTVVQLIDQKKGQYEDISLFGKKTPQVDDATPSKTGFQNSGRPNVNKMDTKDLYNLASKMK